MVFKYAAQGLSHGHYDKLSYSLYDRGDEVVQDYGLVRFVNIEQKGGGNYLKENNTWAKQTIAHNTLVQNQRSHFNGKYEMGSQHHSQLNFYDDSRDDIQIVSARESNAYPGTQINRTMAIIKPEKFATALVLDIMKVESENKNQYDLPLHFMGQVMNTNFEYKTPEILSPLGDENGYQHLYLEGEGKASSAMTQFNWLVKGKFYTMTAATDTADELLFARLGANDPEFNLRRDAALILRRNHVDNTVFASVIEPHGRYSPVSELSVNPNTNITGFKVVHDSEDYTAVRVEDKNGQISLLVIANSDLSPKKQHLLNIEGNSLRWQGPYHFVASES